MFHLLRIEPASHALANFETCPMARQSNIQFDTGDKMPVNENHQTNTIREAFLKDSIVIKTDKLILLITNLCFWTNIFDT